MQRFLHQKPAATGATTYDKPTSGDTTGTTIKTSEFDLKKKFRLLICSPSNGGCDELTRRLKKMRHDRTSVFHAIENSRGHRFNIIRVGRTDSIHSDCDDVGFDAMVKAKMDQLICKKQSERSSSLMEHYNTLITTENNLRKKIKLLKESSSANKNDASVYIDI